MKTFSEINSPRLFQKKEICVYLGTFDPFHRGHAWLVNEGLCRCDGLLLLLPDHHFHKDLHSRERATLQHRLKMVILGIESFGDKNISVASTACILYLKLHSALHRSYPKVNFTFLMGDESFQKMQKTEEYYNHCGLRWGRNEAKQLKDIASQCIVFNRSGRYRKGIVCPREVRNISSTQIRDLIRTASQNPAVSKRQLFDQLSRSLAPPIIDYILEGKLYCYTGRSSQAQQATAWRSEGKTCETRPMSL